MQKKLITLAVAGVLATPMMAQAAVEVYGQARVSVGSISNDDSTAGNDKSKLAVSSHASRLGFKGNDDLGGGLKALWQIERGIDLTDKTGAWSDRNTFAGLAGGFGTVILGTHDTPYKIATGSLDPFADTYADYNAVIDSTNDARSKNVIAYISPDMSGFTLAAAYITDFADDNLTDTTHYGAGAGATKKKQPAISLAGMYTNGPLFASLAYQKVDETGNTPAGATKADPLKATKLGVGYKINQFSLGLVYEDVDGGNSIKQKNTYLTGGMDVGSGVKVNLALGKKGNPTGTSNADAKFFAIGANKSLSANTEAYVQYANIKDGKSAGAAYGLGVGNQTIGAAGAAGSDAKASALAVGLNVKFSSM